MVNICILKGFPMVGHWKPWKGIYLKLCCHCVVDLCHDRCACLAGQSASIKSSIFECSGEGMARCPFIRLPSPNLSLSLPPLLSLSPCLSFFSSFCSFAQSLHVPYYKEPCAQQKLNRRWDSTLLEVRISNYIHFLKSLWSNCIDPSRAVNMANLKSCHFYMHDCVSHCQALPNYIFS